MALLPSKFLPRFLGASHVPEALPHVLKFVDETPVDACIGLELDWSHPYIANRYPALSSLMSKNSFFSKIATHVRDSNSRLGFSRSVRWLERPSSYVAGTTKQLKELEPLVQRKLKNLLAHLRGEAPLEELDQKTNELFQQIDEIEKSTGSWRSRLMRREIDKNEWLPSDLVITGRGHAKQFAEAYDVPVFHYVGPTGLVLPGSRQYTELIERLNADEARHQQFMASRIVRKLR